MSTRVTEQVDDWEGRPFTGGYRELQDLAAENFSGVVRADGAELYVTKGTVVGVRNGSIEDFETAEGTAYEAPTPALPLLAIMQERSEEVRAQYYTEDTSISTVDKKLEDGGFTGFVELSENVLSGDYYVVYHQGQSMSVAFVGNLGQLLEGEEAFERADDEVGIYTVHPVDIEPVEIPGPTEPEPDETAEPEGGGEPDADPEAITEPDADPEADTADTGGETETDTDETDSVDGVPGAEHTAAEPTGASAPEAGQPVTEEPAESAGEAATTAESIPSEVPDRQGTRPADSPGPSPREADRSSRGEGPAETTDSQGTEPSASGSGGHPDLETRSIPSLDPGQTEADDRGPDLSQSDDQVPPGTPERERPGTRGAGDRDPQPPGQSRDPERTRRGSEAAGTTESAPESPTDSGGATAGSGREAVDTDRIEQLEADLEDRREEIERLEKKLRTAREQKEQLEGQLASVREERDELAAEVDRLQDELDRLETEFGAAIGEKRRMSPTEALGGTDIFVRYGSKGDATLEKAHGGGIPQSDVVDNLELETHTQFDADAVSVGGQSYDEFLETTLEYQFVRWVAEELLFEIRDTGHTDTLETLYDALPEIDRAELGGTVDVVYTDEGGETRSTESFDVVYRNRMGEPLLVASLNDSREAATESMMEEIITAAERVGQTSEEFAAAFLVTASFFEPAALETADEVTRGGLLSRNKQKSFVKLSRKRGYHLCLVEARSDNFNLTVPEL